MRAFADKHKVDALLKDGMVERLYRHMGRNLGNVARDYTLGFLTDSEGSDGKDYFLFYDFESEVAINRESGSIIVDDRQLVDLFE